MCIYNTSGKGKIWTWIPYFVVKCSNYQDITVQGDSTLLFFLKTKMVTTAAFYEVPNSISKCIAHTVRMPTD